jgi:sulfite reductase (ferredoxin)
VPEAIERLLRSYLADGNPGENLRHFFSRHTNDELRDYLAGQAIEPVARDIPEGRVPSGIEG